MLNLINHLKH